MEKEKLDEGIKTFEEDTEKYKKFKMDLQAKSNKADDELKRVQQTIETMAAQISELKNLEQDFDSKMQKIDDEVTMHRKHKRFLDLIAIASKNKVPVNQQRRKMLKAMKEKNFELNMEKSTNMKQLQRTMPRDQSRDKIAVSNRAQKKSKASALPRIIEQELLPAIRANIKDAFFITQNGTTEGEVSRRGQASQKKLPGVIEVSSL